MQKEGRLQGFGQSIGPKDGPVEPIQLTGVFEGIESKGNQAKEIEVGGARSAPAPKENVEADDEIDEANDAQTPCQAAVQGLGNDFDGRIERDAVAGDVIENLAVGTGAVESAVEVGSTLNREFVTGSATGDSGEKVLGLNAGYLSGLPGQNALGFQATVGLVPPDAVVRLLKMAFLLKIE